jgi:hypothetical protein
MLTCLKRKGRRLGFPLNWNVPQIEYAIDHMVIAL